MKYCILFETLNIKGKAIIMQVLSLVKASALIIDSEPTTLAEAAYIGWKKLDPNTTKVYPIIPDLKLNPAAQYDMAKLLASGISPQHLLNSPWGRTETGRKIINEYIDEPKSSPLRIAIRNYKQSMTKSSAAIYYAEQMKIALEKPLSKEDIDILQILLKELADKLNNNTGTPNSLDLF